MKVCIKCNKEKENSEFKPKSEKCIECYREYQANYRAKNKEKMKEYNQNYYKENKEEILTSVKKYYSDNKEQVSEYKTKYWNENRQVLSQKNKDYYQDNKERLDLANKEYNKKNRKRLNKRRNQRLKERRTELNQKIKERRLIDPIYRLSQNIRTYVRNSFKFKGFKKNTKTEMILGCSFTEFKIHIESQFESWMTWENYGLYNGSIEYGWDIDHIVPISSGKTEEEVIRLNHFTNLRPLCSLINRYIKSDNIDFKKV